MSTDFLNCTPAKQKTLFIETATYLDMTETIIEKDFWVCWILEQLFALPHGMVFKGGTSLSKGYQLIDRFSEDLDITIDS